MDLIIRDSERFLYMRFLEFINIKACFKVVIDLKDPKEEFY